MKCEIIAKIRDYNKNSMQIIFIRYVEKEMKEHDKIFSKFMFIL